MSGLTVEEIGILIEALDAWSVASKRDSLLAAMFLGAMIQGAGGNGKETVDQMMSGEDQKQETRKEQATLLKSRLIKMCDAALVRQLAEESAQ